ncbi:MAG: hypothetical protein ACRD9W_02535 [Terriglobia bacterium]
MGALLREWAIPLGSSGDFLTEAEADARYLRLIGGQLSGLLDLSPATAGQIKFPATPNLSTDVDTLDAYSEGTWTPALDGSPGTITISSIVARYCRVGQMIFLNCGFNVATVSGASQPVALTGFPFTIASTSPVRFTGSLYIGNAVSTLTGTPAARIQSGSTNCFLDKYLNGVINSITVNMLKVGTTFAFAAAYNV